VTADTPHHPDPWAHRRGEPRTFAAAWMFFLLVAAAVALSAGGVLGLLGTAPYRASARVLMVVLGLGVGVLWPLLRLSQESPGDAARAMRQDLLIVAASTQAVVLPQGLPWMGDWPFSAVAAVGVGLAAWALLVAGVLGLVWRSAGRIPRWAAMLALVVLASAGPMWALAVGARESALREALLAASPVTLGPEILADRSWLGQSAKATPAHVWTIAATASAGALAWWLASGRVARWRQPA
jgi:hypothetical protein